MNTAFFQSQIGQFVVGAPIGRRLKVVVVLVVHFGLAEGFARRVVRDAKFTRTSSVHFIPIFVYLLERKLCCIIDIHQLLAQGIAVVSLALFKFEPRRRSSCLDLWIDWMPRSARQSNQ